MPVPKIDIPVYTVSEDEKKLDELEIALYGTGYNCEEPKDMIQVINIFKLDKSQFDFPFGSYDAFKARVLNGEYDDYGVIKFMTDEEVEAMERDIEEGRACI